MEKGAHTLNRDKMHYTIPQARSLIVQLLEAVEFLHSEGVAHCDLKPGNIVIFPGDSDSGTRIYECRIIDFGLSCRVVSPNATISRMTGTVGLTAPEVCADIPYSPMRADLWSSGQLIRHILSEVSEEWEDDTFVSTAYQVARRLSTREPSRRISAAQAIKLL